MPDPNAEYVCPTCDGRGVIPARRRGYRRMVGRSWTGVVFESLTGAEVGECGHRHFVDADEAMACSGLDQYFLPAHIDCSRAPSESDIS